jgi:predicted DNA-binding transcriptional regulator YafY
VRRPLPSVGPAGTGQPGTQVVHANLGWSGQELADQLGVTTRTIRNDMERLRDLGYPVHASPGVGGGYRLGAGAALPPLLLDDPELVEQLRRLADRYRRATTTTGPSSG